MRGVWFFLLLAGCCAAEQADYVLAGTVVNAKTREPVKRAVVTAFGLGSLGKADPSVGARERFRGSAQPVTLSAFTDVSGAFRFTGLASGTYSISVLKLHYAQDAARAAVQIDSSSKEDLRIELSPLGTIEGRVTNQRGEPASGISILVLEVSIHEGWQQTSVARSVRTDDRGIFRVWDIEPGRYFVKAAGRAGWTATYLADAAPSANAGLDGFAVTYFGGPTADSAAPVVIEAGTEARADIGVVAQPAHRVRGTLYGFGPGGVEFALLSGEEDVATGRVNFSDGRGAACADGLSIHTQCHSAGPLRTAIVREPECQSSHSLEVDRRRCGRLGRVAQPAPRRRGERNGYIQERRPAGGNAGAGSHLRVGPPLGIGYRRAGRQLLISGRQAGQVSHLRFRSRLLCRGDSLWRCRAAGRRGERRRRRLRLHY